MTVNNTREPERATAARPTRLGPRLATIVERELGDTGDDRDVVCSDVRPRLSTADADCLVLACHSENPVLTPRRSALTVESPLMSSADRPWRLWVTLAWRISTRDSEIVRWTLPTASAPRTSMRP